uniref:Uncharacterized protein n=1 Tax=Romanomermis culicivorax TaxID=13658 RepID=A0A915LDN0_ROMCU
MSARLIGGASGLKRIASLRRPEEKYFDLVSGVNLNNLSVLKLTSLFVTVSSYNKIDDFIM